MAMLERVGAFEDPDEAPFFAPFERPLGEKDLEGAELDPETGIWTKDGKGIGIQQDGRAVRGFRTPSRKMEIYSEFVVKTGRNEDTSELTALANSKGKNRPGYHKGNEYDIHPWPKFSPIDEHQDMGDDQLVMTSFKWNVHNHGRTANLKWCSEIVHSNPAWIHPDTAKRMGLEDGDFVELTGHRSSISPSSPPASPRQRRAREEAPHPRVDHARGAPQGAGDLELPGSLGVHERRPGRARQRRAR